MKWLRCSFFYLFIFTFSILSGAHPTVCLNMIVKNEKDVIIRCLASVKPLIDYWVIDDTGSTDGTQEIIKEFLKDIPGELHEHPWKNFGYNRNLALELAKGKGDYILIIDADDVLEYPEGYKWPELTLDGYFLNIKDAGTIYHRYHLINNHIPWKWHGVLHEGLGSSEAKTSLLLENIAYRRIGGGDRSKDPSKYLKDAQILEEALLEEPENSRYVFYLAQSYQDGGNYPKAIENYEKRVAMGGWKDEVFYSKYRIAAMKEALNKDPSEFIKAYEEAFEYAPNRVEPLYGLVHYYRKRGDFEAGYNAAIKGLHIPVPKGSLFVSEWIYNIGLPLEFSICAYYREKYIEALLATQRLLANPDVSPEVKACLENNLKWATFKIAEQLQVGKEPSL